MARILIVTRDDDGVAPALGVGAALRRRGHDVRVLGHPQQYPAVHAAGLGFAAYTQAPPAPPTGAPTERQLLANQVAQAIDPRPGLEVRAELVRRPPDLVLVDALSLAALKAAQRSGVPTAALLRTFHRFGTHHWARGAVGVAATLRGLRPRKLWDAAGRVLVATDPDLDPATDLPANVRHVGAVLGPVRPPAREPEHLVAVSLGSQARPGRGEVLQRVLDALAAAGVPALVATGDGVDRASLNPPAGVELHRRIDHADLLARAHLLIGHGGHDTTVRALANDLPVLVLPPHPPLDHAVVGEAVARVGAGRMLDAHATPETIREAVAALLADGPQHAAAAAAGARIRSRDGAAVAADELEAQLSGVSGGGDGSRTTRG